MQNQARITFFEKKVTKKLLLLFFTKEVFPYFSVIGV
jgi:hypothetical protein